MNIYALFFFTTYCLACQGMESNSIEINGGSCQPKSVDICESNNFPPKSPLNDNEVDFEKHRMQPRTCAWQAACVAALPNGCIVSGDCDGTVQIRCEKTGNPKLKLENGFNKNVNSVGVLANGDIVAQVSTYERTFNCDSYKYEEEYTGHGFITWDAQTNKPKLRYSNCIDGISSVSGLANGDIVASANSKIWRWDCAGKLKSIVYKGHNFSGAFYGMSVAGLPIGDVALSNGTSTIGVYDGTTGDIKWVNGSEFGTINRIAVLRNGDIVGAGWGTLRVWEGSKGDQKLALKYPRMFEDVASVAGLANGDIIVVTYDKKVQVFDGTTQWVQNGEKKSRYEPKKAFALIGKLKWAYEKEKKIQLTQDEQDYFHNYLSEQVKNRYKRFVRMPL